MPSEHSSDGAPTYRAVPPPKQQQRFPNRRRSMKPPALLPTLSKRQSTLTQLQFASPKSTREPLPISSDEDEDYEEAPPSKKRKTGSKSSTRREPGQSSMTQFERGEIAGASKRSKPSDVGSAAFEVWEDYDPQAWEAETQLKLARGSTRVSRLRDSAGIQPEDDEELEIPETSQLHVESSPRVDSGIEAHDKDVARKYLTPRKDLVRTEVPSSQSPPSTKSSAQRLSQRVDTARRSPLKERSDNILSRVPIDLSPESQNTSMKMLQRVRFGQQSTLWNDTYSPMPSPEKIASSQKSVQLSVAASLDVDKPQQLKRVTTIEDSQPDYVEIIEFTQRDGIASQYHSLHRTTTIQDSQPDSRSTEVLPESEIYGSYLGNVYASQSQFHDLQSTYDPAYSALDRDAARFRWTQSQKPLSRVDEDDDVDKDEDATKVEVGSSCETDDEEDEGDLDIRCVPSTSHPNIPSLYEPRCNVLEADPDLRQEQYKHQINNETAEDAMGHVKLGQDSPLLAFDRPARSKEPPPLSSPPALLHPSQVSTVVPTQITQHDLSRAESKSHLTLSAPEVEKLQPSSQPATPHHPLSRPMESLTSSPLPLPPWSQLETRSAKVPSSQKTTREGSSITLEDLIDFSLPPPPPLSSSMRSSG